MHPTIDEYTTIGVRFPGTIRAYTYKALRKYELKVGDEVVVDSPSSGPVVVIVVSVDQVPVETVKTAPEGYKWIVDKIDRSEYDTLRRG
jgi:hypothetical protein